MKKLIVLFLGYFSVAVFGVSMNFHGNFRAEGTYYKNADLGSGSNDVKQFIGARGLLNPDIIIDDHFSIRSQWSLLTSPVFTPNGGVPLGVGQGGWIFGDVQSLNLQLSRAWLEWTSDFGVFRIGRMPFSWGYGLVWDAGNQTWDDFQTTYDRLEYRLHLGNIIGALAYSKPRKLSVLGNSNDSEFYTVYLQYRNPEMEVEGGILYEKQERSTSQNADLRGDRPPGGGVSPNPLNDPANSYPLSNKTPYARSNDVVNVYLKKTMGRLTMGGELAWLSGEAIDYNGNGTPDSLNGLGVLLSASYEIHTVKGFIDALYVSGDANLNDDNNNGFVLMNRNRRPGLILGRELLGPYYGNNAGLGSLLVYGDADTYSGVIYVRPGVRIEWSKSWASALEIIYAQKATVSATDTKNLGLEVDFGTDYSVYRNFDLGAKLGYLFAGAGLRVGAPKNVFALSMTASLTF